MRTNAINNPVAVFFMRPHPIVVFFVCILACVMVWRGATLLNRYAQPTGLDAGDLKEATVVRVIDQTSEYNDLVRRTITTQTLEVEVKGDANTYEASNDMVEVPVGARVYVSHDQANDVYFVAQISRVHSSVYLILAFILVVLLVTGLSGMRSLVGLLWSAGVMTAYTIPRLMAGDNPIQVGIVSAMIILIVSLYVSHGINKKTIAAVTGLSVTLTVVAVLSRIAVHAFHFTGVAGEESFLLQGIAETSLDYVGLLIAGIIIAGVGVLDDIAITQSSTVFALAESAEHLKGGALFKKAMQVGRDHIAAVVNTLIMAYAGAALPLIMLMVISGQGPLLTMSNEIVSQEVVRTFVSSIGLVLAVPLTTLLATVLAAKKDESGHKETRTQHLAKHF